MTPGIDDSLLTIFLVVLELNSLEGNISTSRFFSAKREKHLPIAAGIQNLLDKDFF